MKTRNMRLVGMAVLVVSLAAFISPAHAGGTVNFGNNSSNKVVNGHTAAPITAAANVQAALYWSPLASNNFVQLGSPVTVGVPAAGIFVGGTRTTGDATSGGTSAKFLVRAWAGGYTTYEEAVLQPGVLIGQSAVIVNPTGNSGGSPPAPPESLLTGGFTGFVISSNVIGTQPPIISGLGNKTVPCDAPWSFDTPTATDGCTGTNLTAAVLSTTTNGLCPRDITRTWSVTNSCDTNFATHSQTVTVVDTTPPALECASNKVVECGSPFTFDVPAVNDACGTNALSVLSIVTNAACGATFSATCTWRATDACGNSSGCSQTVTVVDTVPPVLTCATNKLLPCGAEWAFDEPAAYDPCGGTNLMVTIVSTVTNIFCPPVVTRTWAAVDGCGNSNTCSQTVTATPALQFKVPDPKVSVVSCTNEWSFNTYELLDDCGSNVNVEVVGTVTNSLCPLSLTRTWRLTHPCRPEGVEWSQTVLVLCPSCPLLQLTKSCPAYPVPPGGTLAWAGTITNASDITVSNVVVMNDQPTTNTLVFGPVTLAPGEGTSFSGSYTVTTCCGPYGGTLSAIGTGLDGILITGSATASCAGTNHVTPGDLNGDGIVDQGELNAVLANYWAHSPWVYMTNAALLCDGRFQFELTNASAWNFTVLVSTNATDWTNLPAPAFPVYQFVDPEGTNSPQRFYRLQWP